MRPEKVTGLEGPAPAATTPVSDAVLLQIPLPDGVRVFEDQERGRGPLLARMQQTRAAPVIDAGMETGPHVRRSADHRDRSNLRIQHKVSRS